MVAARILVPAVLAGIVVAFALGHWVGPRQLGDDLIVVLDGGADRLARADHFRQQFDLQQPQQLLIRCPAARRQAQPPQRIWIATDPEHTARANHLARISLAGRGIQIQPDPPPTPSPGERRKLVRDALRMSLWRVTGSAGGWLVPQAVARKRLQFGL